MIIAAAGGPDKPARLDAPPPSPPFSIQSPAPDRKAVPVTVADRIRSKLTGALAPTRLEIEDDSERHRGHSGAAAIGESHFQVTVVSEQFEGLSKVARHRVVYALLAEELAERIHALGLKTLAPSEEA